MFVSREQKARIDSKVYRYLSDVCGDDVKTLKVSSIAKEVGIGRDSVMSSLKRLMDDGKVDYDRVSNQKNDGFRFVVLLDAKGPAPAKTTTRVCPVCGEPATDNRARFCFVCGASLLSKKELLKERYMNVLPKLSRLIVDAKTANEILTVLGQVAELAFEGD